MNETKETRATVGIRGEENIAFWESLPHGLKTHLFNWALTYLRKLYSTPEGKKEIMNEVTETI